MLSLLKNAAFERIMNAVAAGQTDQTSSRVDMSNHEVATFVVAFGTITSGAVTSIKLQASSDDGSSDAYSDLEGTSVTVTDADSNKIFIVEVVRPEKRDLKLIVDRGTQNAVIDGVWVVKTHPRVRPVTQGATVGGGESHVSPAEGTA